jgi:hypothetical protein
VFDSCNVAFHQKEPTQPLPILGIEIIQAGYDFFHQINNTQLEGYKLIMHSIAVIVKAGL